MDVERPWTDFIIRGCPARRTFPKNPPSLLNLQFLRIVILGSGVNVVVRFPSLPEGTPAKWAQLKYHQLDLVFRFDLPKIIHFDLQGCIDYKYDPVNIHFSEKKFSMMSASAEEVLSLTFLECYAFFVPDADLQLSDFIRDLAGSDLETY
ncbi:hypothetical protein [Elioraea sp.]|uniref:hypothetical protein n=1 Tax=Elioraea sp. TaxID=2185103 RepID=UPI0025C55405|nr:hypothetical protein [Elioraea sp.]